MLFQCKAWLYLSFQLTTFLFSLWFSLQVCMCTVNHQHCNYTVYKWLSYSQLASGCWKPSVVLIVSHYSSKPTISSVKIKTCPTMQWLPTVSQGWYMQCTLYKIPASSLQRTLFVVPNSVTCDFVQSSSCWPGLLAVHH